MYIYHHNISISYRYNTTRIVYHTTQYNIQHKRIYICIHLYYVICIYITIHQTYVHIIMYDRCMFMLLLYVCDIIYLYTLCICMLICVSHPPWWQQAWSPSSRAQGSFSPLSPMSSSMEEAPLKPGTTPGSMSCHVMGATVIYVCSLIYIYLYLYTLIHSCPSYVITCMICMHACMSFMHSYTQMLSYRYHHYYIPHIVSYTCIWYNSTHCNTHHTTHIYTYYIHYIYICNTTQHKQHNTKRRDVIL